MKREKVDFTGIEWGSVECTMLGTLYVRAYESRVEHPILGDHAAAEAIDRIEYDFARLDKFMKPARNQFIVALRAKQFDLWAADFLARNPDATVLHLGCGLDSRPFRLHLPAGVRWYDLDVPDVIELRRQVYPEGEHYKMIGSSVTDPDWLEEVPADRPALVIAEGLLPYLAEDDVRQLLRRITDRFDSGELLFDGMPPWMIRLAKIFKWGIRDRRQLEEWNPRLKFVTETSPVLQYSKIPVGRYRTLMWLCGLIPAMRAFDRQFRFRF
jgi:O-methyltransferase involved in polyketide biosynthesis